MCWCLRRKRKQVRTLESSKLELEDVSVSPKKNKASPTPEVEQTFVRRCVGVFEFKKVDPNICGVMQPHPRGRPKIPVRFVPSTFARSSGVTQTTKLLKIHVEAQSRPQESSHILTKKSINSSRNDPKIDIWGKMEVLETPWGYLWVPEEPPGCIFMVLVWIWAPQDRP